MKTNSSTEILRIDLGDKKHSVCVLGADGKILDESTVANTREAMARLSKKHRGALVVMEVGMQTPWVSRHFAGLGHRVLAANPRKVRAIYQNDRKCDRKDAVMLAKLARADERLLRAGGDHSIRGSGAGGRKRRVFRQTRTRGSTCRAACGFFSG